VPRLQHLLLTHRPPRLSRRVAVALQNQLPVDIVRSLSCRHRCLRTKALDYLGAFYLVLACALSACAPVATPAPAVIASTLAPVPTSIPPTTVPSTSVPAPDLVCGERETSHDGGADYRRPGADQ